MMDNNHFNYLDLEECDPFQDNFIEVFSKNVKSCYLQENIINKNVRNFVLDFKLAFENAIAKEEEYLNPTYNVIFSFDYPKLSALFSLSLHIYMSGGLKFTDTSIVCLNCYYLLIITYWLVRKTS